MWFHELQLWTMVHYVDLCLYSMRRPFLSGVAYFSIISRKRKKRSSMIPLLLSQLEAVSKNIIYCVMTIRYRTSSNFQISLQRDMKVLNNYKNRKMLHSCVLVTSDPYLLWKNRAQTSTILTLYFQIDDSPKFYRSHRKTRSTKCCTLEMHRMTIYSKWRRMSQSVEAHTLPSSECNQRTSGICTNWRLRRRRWKKALLV